MNPGGSLAEVLEQIEVLLDKYDQMTGKERQYTRPRIYDESYLIGFFEFISSWTMNNHCAETREPYTHEQQRAFDTLAQILGLEIRMETEDENIDRRAEEEEELRLNAWSHRKHRLN